jgi:GWxTD domain-containing protein
MIWLESWIRHPLAAAIGHALAHSVWQAGIVALILAVVVGCARSSRIRYAAACVALLTILLAFVITFVFFTPAQPINGPRTTHSLPLPADLSSAEVIAESPWHVRLTKLLPWITPPWAFGVLIFNLRHLAGWLRARRMIRKGVCAASEAWQDRLEQLRSRLAVSRAVVLLESCFLNVPAVVGHLRPVVLVPAGLLTGLRPEQIELILMHELAHIRRHDYLVNMLQTFVEGLLFYNPAVWWISNVIRTEREHCCDDFVVATANDAHAYALVLAALEKKRSHAAELALAATGGPLVKRIRRLLTESQPPSIPLLPLFSLGVALIAATIALNAGPASLSPAPMPAAPVPAAQQLDALRQWLEMEAAYIISPEERFAFETLQTDEEREHFIEQFWQRRDPTPGTVENEFKDEHYWRIRYTNDHFTVASTPGWKTDRARVFITWGPPNNVEYQPVPNQPPTYAFERWRYRFVEGVGSNVFIEFADTTGTGDLKRFRSTGSRGPDPTLQPVSIVGAVQVPGIYAVRDTKFLLDMLAMARGLDPRAGNIIEIVRRKDGATETITIDVQELFSNSNPALNIQISSGDVINVLHAKPAALAAPRPPA